MPVDNHRPGGSHGPGLVRGPQSVAAGIFLVLIAAVGFWLARDLSLDRTNAIGPATLPRWLSVGLGACGLALIGAGFFKAGERLERWSLRGPLVVLVAILAFAVTIRPFTFGPLTTPGLGLLAAGPLAILIGGCASSDARLRDLVILALTLTPFCMVLFGDLLNLPIPVFPQSMAQLFPDGWSQKQILRAMAALMALVALAIYLATRGRRGDRARIDVADHSGRI
ncbi:MAG: tripartite tricarboxylate transporter TctB family protein [Microvirga sp.]